jgi:hypothetical protein
MNILFEVGDYSFIEEDEKIYIEGKSGRFNFSDFPTEITHVYPMTKEALEKAENEVVLSAYPFKDNFIYYFIDYGNALFILKELKDVLEFQKAILELQTVILQQTFSG